MIKLGAWVNCAGCGRRERPRRMVITVTIGLPEGATPDTAPQGWCPECVDLLAMAIDGRRRGVRAGAL